MVLFLFREIKIGFSGRRAGLSKCEVSMESAFCCLGNSFIDLEFTYYTMYPFKLYTSVDFRIFRIVHPSQ